MQQITVRYTVGTETKEKIVSVMVSKNSIIIASHRIAKPRHFSAANPLQVSGAIAQAVARQQ